MTYQLPIACWIGPEWGVGSISLNNDYESITQQQTPHSHSISTSQSFQRASAKTPPSDFHLSSPSQTVQTHSIHMSHMHLPLASLEPPSHGGGRKLMHRFLIRRLASTSQRRQAPEHNTHDPDTRPAPTLTRQKRRECFVDGRDERERVGVGGVQVGGRGVC
eukprot:388376-Rhodomonas_salina.1